jgi:hypothetical protein
MPTTPFGKTRDRPLTQVPTSYLEWLLREVTLRPWLHHEVVEELGRREQAEQQPAPGPMIDREALGDLVSRWFRQLALKWHPDRGDSDKAMAALHDARDSLRELLGLDSER